MALATNTVSALSPFVSIFLVYLLNPTSEEGFQCCVRYGTVNISLNLFAGRLAKKECAAEFSRRGCSLCLNFLESEDALTVHRLQCQFVSACASGKVFSSAFLFNIMLFLFSTVYFL